MGKLESEHQKVIMKDLRSYQKFITCWKHIVTSENKIPDIFFTSCYTGPCLIELKKDDGEPCGGQIYKIKKLNKTGIKAFVVKGVDGYIKLKKHLNINLENLKSAHVDDDIDINKYYFK